MELTTTSLLALVMTLSYAALLSIAWRFRSAMDKTSLRWLFFTLLAAGITGLFSIMPTDTQLGNDERLSQPALGIYATSLLLVMYGSLTMVYLKRIRAARLWLLTGSTWWLVLLATAFSVEPLRIGTFQWINTAVEEADPAGLVALGGWSVIGLAMLAVVFQTSLRASLPEVANRALFWAMTIPLVLMGAILNAAGEPPLREMGWVIQLVGICGAVYGVISLRVIDIRRTVRSIILNIALILLTSIAVLIGYLIVDNLEFETDSARSAAIAIVAFLSVGLAIPTGIVAQFFIKRLLRQTGDDLTIEIGRFAEAITSVVELPQLAEVVMRHLREGVRVRRGCLIMASVDERNTLRMEPYRIGMGEIPTIHSWLNLSGPIYQTLYTERKTLLQYDLDFSNQYADITPAERDFFRQMRMAAYAPIVVQGKLIGILAAGPKINDDPFYPADLDLLSTIANQAGVALRNARLVDDLLKREHDIAESNRRLESAKRQLEALDAVKTDFVTIASHELRTPLAQIRGHTDIIEALNDQGMLDKDQLAGLTSNLRKAADRMEGLIGDMLDVSQLDLSAMDLRFNQMTVENAVRLAIEPLQESIRNRRQSLTARGLRGLPALNGDMQRMVQAIRNVVLNAVKYTPDGGRIEIAGGLQVNEKTGQDEILISIKDSGIGIDPANHEAIFEKFFRIGDPGLHSTGKTKFMGAGPGLGLTIARGVITGHGGRIWVESPGYDTEKLPGSTFYIVLPVNPPAEGRRTMSIGRTTGIFEAPTRAKKPVEPAPEMKETAETPEEEQPFEEHNPTVFNPSASRAGLAAAAKKAAEEAVANVVAEIEEMPSAEDSSEEKKPESSE